MFQGTQLVPSKMFFTTGVGTHREKLVSFEMALRAAGIAQHNLVRISSILPPECKIVEREEGVRRLRPGQIVFCVLSEAATNEPGRRVGASIGVARGVEIDEPHMRDPGTGLRRVGHSRKRRGRLRLRHAARKYALPIEGTRSRVPLFLTLHRVRLKLLHLAREE